MAILHGFWLRYAPRPLDGEAIDEDLEAFLLWIAKACDGLDPEGRNVHQRPFQFGARFCENARGPSMKSSDVSIAAAAG